MSRLENITTDELSKDQRDLSLADEVSGLGFENVHAVSAEKIMSRRLESTIQQSFGRIDSAPVGERRRRLDELALVIVTCLRDRAEVELVFVCTHNSRRSQLAEIWARAAAEWEDLDGVRTFSAGTEVTACNPRTVDALRREGVEIELLEPGDNAVYGTRLGPDLPQHLAYSKLLDDPSLPTTGHIAVMTCAAADAACPYVPNASARIALPFIDPKVADDTPEEAATYDLRSRQIASEMLWVMARVSALLPKS